MDKSANRVWKPAAFISAVLFVIFYFPEPGRVVVDSGGGMSWFNSIQAIVQGKKFWRSQNELAKKLLQTLQQQPREDAKFEAEMRELEAELERSDAEVCAKDRALCLTPAEQEAAKLRKMADEIEYAEERRQEEIFRRERMAELRMVISLTEKRMR